MSESSGNSSSHGGHSGGNSTSNSTSSQGGGKGGGGGGWGSPAMMAIIAQRKAATDQQVKIFAASLCGLIAIFILFHWTRWLWARAERSMNAGRSPALGKPFVSISRLIRNVLVRKVPGFTSAGHALLVATYVAINVSVTFTNLDTGSNNLSIYAARFAWMALGNFAFVIFLSLKNTPLAFLTAYSYERLNCLHQIAGYTLFGFIVLHGSFYTAYFKAMGKLTTIFAEPSLVAAIVAAFALLATVFASAVLRRVWYELFYVVHIGGWIMLIVAVGFHQPEFGKGLIVTLFIASMWFSDRLIRASRVLYYSANNSATLHPLPNGGTKIVMKKVPARAEAGKHCFVWIPAIRRFETHPFTIHKTNPVEFTVKAHNGFTSDLHKYALDHPGVAVTASIDGPYGTFPDPMEYDKIVLIAGGGGATFTFGLAVNVLERMKDEAHKNVVFIWAVQKHENLAWFEEQLEILKTHAHSPKVDVALYVTKSPSSPSQTPDMNGRSSQSSLGGASTPISPVVDDPEKQGGPPQLPLPTRRAELTEKDLEKEMDQVIETRVEHGALDKDGGPATTTISHASRHIIKAGRPNVASLIRDAVVSTPPNQRVLVAACGPDGLMRVVRDTTAKLISGDGPGVELHCEQFGW